VLADGFSPWRVLSRWRLKPDFVITGDLASSGWGLIQDMITSRSPWARAVVRPANPSTSLARDRLIDRRGVLIWGFGEEKLIPSRSEAFESGAKPPPSTPRTGSDIAIVAIGAIGGDRDKNPSENTGQNPLKFNGAMTAESVCSKVHG